ncbi:MULTISPECIES: hypothetical protein [Paraburkholderia]|uniref:Tyr recombinase domain-containing protein n=1 Tax=Paraburkholderia podalyriae TaxID=1938811 RepID=A0ABR7PT80_9BURK|nr:hypothetical protein [Paraburkholderia podalyriae]MBC8749486.1 hypothetical protein [Paraburkholderia podalyriae]
MLIVDSQFRSARHLNRFAPALFAPEPFNKGFDEVVVASILTVRTMLASRALRVSSIVSYCTAGLTYFFDYLETVEVRPTSGELNSRLMQGFIKWLATERSLRYTAQRNVYAATKSVLSEMIRLQLVSSDPSIFPPNPYPKASAQVEGVTPFTMTERKRLVDALKRELIAVQKGDFVGSESEALVIYALALCLRTGLNTVPLIELTRDCVKSHPLRSNMRMLVHTKWRSHSVLHAPIEAKAAQTSISSDAVALLGIVMKRTEGLANEASDRLRNRLWLYRSESSISKGEIRVLVTSDLYRGASRLVSRHGLRGDDDKALRVNPTRFRKTLENRLWRLSGGDLYRLLSFREFLLEEKDRVGSTKWVEHFAWIVRLIDALVSDRFDPKKAAAAAARTKKRRHPFWASPIEHGVRVE